MSNVVQFPAKKQIVDTSDFKVIGPNIKGKPVKEPRNGKEYLDICKEFIDPEDYKDILCGIMDREHYDGLEPELQKIIDCYYGFEL